MPRLSHSLLFGCCCGLLALTPAAASPAAGDTAPAWKEWKPGLQVLSWGEDGQEVTVIAPDRRWSLTLFDLREDDYRSPGDAGWWLRIANRDLIGETHLVLGVSTKGAEEDEARPLKTMGLCRSGSTAALWRGALAADPKRGTASLAPLDVIAGRANGWCALPYDEVLPGPLLLNAGKEIDPPSKLADGKGFALAAVDESGRFLLIHGQGAFQPGALWRQLRERAVTLARAVLLSQGPAAQLAMSGQERAKGEALRTAIGLHWADPLGEP